MRTRQELEEFVDAHEDMREQFIVHLQYIEEALEVLEKKISMPGYKKDSGRFKLLADVRQRLGWLRDSATGLEATKFVYDENAGMILQ